MTYCSVQDVLDQVPRERAVELTNDTESRLDGAEVVTSVVEKCIVAAQSIVDGYLRSVVRLPLDRIDPVIATTTRDLAIFELYKRRVVLDMPEGLSELRKAAMATLKGIANGDLRIDLPTCAAEPAFTMAVRTPTRVFDDHSLAGYGT